MADHSDSFEAEVQNILDDRVAWYSQYLKVRDKHGQIVPFNLYDFQKKLEREAIIDELEGRPSYFLILKARQGGACLVPETRILTASLQWVELEDVRLGEKVVSCEEYPKGMKHPGKGVARKLKVATVEAKRELESDTFRIKFDGGEVTATPEHRFLVQRGRAPYAWRRVDEIRVGDRLRPLVAPWDSETPFEDGWFGGMLEPKRFVKSNFWENSVLPGKRLGYKGGHISSIEPAEKRKVIDLQTSTKTFVAEGVISHNSTWTEAHLFRKTLLEANTRVLVTAHKEDASRNIFGMARRFYTNLPRQPGTKKSATNALHMKHNDSEFVVQTAGSGSGAGRSYTFSGWHGCFPGETPILTGNGKIVLAENVQVGDSVITHRGNESYVSAITKRENDKPCVAITPWLGEAITLTVNHKVWTQAGWKMAGELTTNDLLSMPVRKITRDETKWPDLVLKKSPPRGSAMAQTKRSGSGMALELDQEFGFFLGYHLAEGHLVKNKKGQAHSILLARHRDEAAYGDRAWTAVEKYCSSRTVTDREDSLTTTEQFFSAALAEWVLENLYDEDGKIVPDWFFSAGEEFLRGVLVGYLSGDGSKTEEEYTRIRASSVRSSLATQARDIALSLGVGWGRISHRGASVRCGRNEREQWTVGWTGEPARTIREWLGLEATNTPDPSQARPHTTTKGSEVWMAIRSITNTEADVVYDFEVAHEDHSFRTAYFSISNSEIDLWPDGPGLYTAVMQCVPKVPGTIRVLESTSEGPGYLMHDLWTRAYQGKGNFKPFFFPWHHFAEYQTPISWETLLAFGPEDYTRRYGDVLREFVELEKEGRKYAVDPVAELSDRHGEGTEGPGGVPDPGGGSESAETGSPEPDDGGSTEEIGGAWGRADSDPVGREDDPGYREYASRLERAATEGRRMRRLDEGPRADGAIRKRCRNHRHSIQDESLYLFFAKSLTNYEFDLIADFDLTYEQINCLRFLTESECNGDEHRRMREYPCIMGGEPVFVHDGIVAIDEVEPDGEFVLGRQDSGVQDAFRVTTELGYEVTCTANHRLKTPNGFVELQDLEIGAELLLGAGPEDRAGVQKVIYRPEEFVRSEIEITEDLAEFLGFYMGDGSFHNGTLSVVCDSKDTDVVDRVSDLVQMVAGTKPGRRIVGKNGGGTEVRCAKISLAGPFSALGLLRRNGSGGIKRRVHVPDYIKRSPLYVQRAFIRGLFEADGFAHRNGSGFKFFTKYEEFSRDIQVLLMRFGISSRRSRHDKKTPDGQSYEGWELCLRTNESILFSGLIGVVSDRKNARLQLGVGSGCERGRLPVATTDKIVSVEHVGAKRVYDIATESYEFVCGGIVVHNSRPEECFQASGGDVLDQTVLAKWHQNAKENPGTRITFVPEYDNLGRPEAKWEKSKNGATQIFRWPKPHETFVLGLDCAAGTADGDWHVGIVLDVETGEQVAEYRSKSDPDAAVDQIEMLAMLYNKAYTGIEVSGGWGWPFLSHMSQRSHMNGVQLYERVAYDRKNGIKVKVMRPGWDTNTKTRPLMVSASKEAVRKQQCKLRSVETIEECQTLYSNQNKGGKVEARPNHHDDGWTAYSVTCLLRNEKLADRPVDKVEEEKVKFPLFSFVHENDAARAFRENSAFGKIELRQVVEPTCIMPESNDDRRSWI